MVVVLEKQPLHAQYKATTPVLMALEGLELANYLLLIICLLRLTLCENLLIRQVSNT